MALTNTLEVRLELLAQQFESQIERVNVLLGETAKNGKKAEDGVNGFVKQLTTFVERGPTVGSVFNALITKIKNTNAVVALTTVAAVGAVEGLRRMFKQAVDLAAEMKTMSLRTGIAVEDLSRLRVAAELSNTSFHAVTSAVGFFNRQLAAAAGGSEEAQKRLKKVGIEGESLNRALQNPIEGLKLVGDKLAALPSQAQRAGRAQLAFGFAARQVVPLLGQEGKAIEAALSQADRFGNVIGKDFAEKADKHKNAILGIKFLSEALAITFTETLLPSVTSIMEALVGLANNDLIKDFFRTLGETAARAAIAIEGSFKLIQISGIKLRSALRDVGESLDEYIAKKARAALGPFAGQAFRGSPRARNAEAKSEADALAKLQEELAGIIKRFSEVGAAKAKSGVPPVVAGAAELDGERTALERLAKSMGEVLDKVTKGFDPVVSLGKAFSDLAEEGVPGMDKALADLIARLDELAESGDVAAKRARAALEAALVGPPRAEQILGPEELARQQAREEMQRRRIEQERERTPEEMLGFGEEATRDLSDFAAQLVRVQDIFGEIHDLTRKSADSILAFSGQIGNVLVDAAQRGTAAFADFAKQTLRWLAQMITRAIIFKILVGAFPGLGRLLQSVSKFLNPVGTIGFQHTESSVLGRAQESRALAVGGPDMALAAAGGGGETGRPIEVRVYNATPATYVEITDRHVMPRIDQRLRTMNERSFTRGRT